jgi:glycerol-3-phosphate dehydrogenase
MAQTLSSEVRKHNLETLGTNRFDVLVIGGGITGAGVALDAATRGYSVALVEKVDFASGTSSKSTKLVHGGIRYLPNFDFVLVHEALVERGLLLQNAPYLVHPIGFVLPIYDGDRHPVGIPFSTPRGIGLSRLLDIGLWMYDIMAGRRSVKRHHHLSRETVLKLAPKLVSNGLKEGFIYYDAQTNDARLTLALIRTAARYGTVIANYAEVTGFTSEGDKVTGVHVYDHIAGQDIQIRARHVVNATGIFAEKVEELAGIEPQIEVEPSKGVHLVFAREKLQLGNDAIVLPETEDKRILFIVPWESRVIFGTTDTGVGDLDHPIATREDITYLLKYINRYLNVHMTEDDIITTYAGYRPLVKPRQMNQSTARLSRTHAVLQSPNGLVTIVGGKLTTYRRMAQDTLDVLSQRDGNKKPVHPTIALPLQGSAGWPIIEQEVKRKGTGLGVSPQSIEHLGHSYGTEALALLELVREDPTLAERLIADLPYIRAEVIYACRYEMAMTPDDILARRTSIALEDRQRGMEALGTILDLMAKELHWSSEQRTAQVRIYQDRVAQHMPVQQTS